MSRDLRLQVVLSAVDKATAVLRKIAGSNKGLAESLKQARDAKRALDSQTSNLKAYRTLQVQLRENERALRNKKTATDQNRTALENLKTSQTNAKASLVIARAHYNKLSTTLLKGKGNTQAFSIELEKARAELLKNQQAVAHNGNALKVYRDKLRNSESSVVSLTKKQQQLSDRLTPLATKLTETGVNLDRTGQSARELKARQESLTNTLEKQKAALAAVNAQMERRKKLDASLKTMHGAGMNVAAHGLGAAYLGQRAGQATFNFLRPGIDYDTQISELRAVARLAQGDERLEQLKAQARQLGGTTAFSAHDAAAGQTFLARAGFTPQAILASMGDVLDLALGQKMDLARTADLTSNISSAFKIDPEVAGNMTRVADILAATTTRTNVSLEMLGDTMKYLGQAEGLNVTLEQSAALAGLLGNIGIQGSQAGTTLRAMLNRLAGARGAGKKAIEEIGLQVADSAGNMRPITVLLDELYKKTAHLGNVPRAEILKNIFGDEPASGVTELVGQISSGAITNLISELKKSAGENSRAARIMEDNIGGDLLNLESGWEELWITITEMQKGPLRDTIKTINDLVDRVTAWTKANPELAGSILKWTAIILTTITVLGVLGFALGNAMMALSGVGKAFLLLGSFADPISQLLTKGILGVGKALLLLFSPIGIVVALLAAAAFVIYKYWQPIKAFFVGLWQGLVEGMAPLQPAFAALAGLFDPLRPAWEWFTSMLATAWEWVKKLAEPFQATSEQLEGATERGKAFGLWLGTLITTVVNLVGQFHKIGADIIGGLWNGINSRLGWIKEKFSSFTEAIKSWFTSDMEIHSPSRVFARYGRDTLAGYQLGMQREEGGTLQRVQSLSKRIKQVGAGIAISASLAAQPAVAAPMPMPTPPQPPVLERLKSTGPTAQIPKVIQLPAPTIAHSNNTPALPKRVMQPALLPTPALEPSPVLVRINNLLPQLPKPVMQPAPLPMPVPTPAPAPILVRINNLLPKLPKPVTQPAPLPMPVPAPAPALVRINNLLPALPKTTPTAAPVFAPQPAIRINNPRPLGVRNSHTQVIEGDTITIQIHAAPGISSHDIANQVQRALDARDKQKAVRARSALRD